MDTTEGFEGWAILEHMGHRKLAGLVSEETVARRRQGVHRRPGDSD